MNEFGLFDSSLTCQDSRIVFMNYLSSTAAIWHGVEVDKLTVQYVRWLSKRSVSVRNMGINQNVFFALRKTQNGLFGSIKPFKHLHDITLWISSDADIKIGCQILVSGAAYLTKVIANHTNFIDDSFGLEIAEHCHNLTSLDLSHTNISHVSLACILVNNCNMKSVDVCNTSLEDDCGFMQCASLQTLRVSGCRVPRAIIATLVECKLLNTLHLRACYQVTLETIQQILLVCSITDLDVGQCLQVLGDDFLRFVAKNATQINHLCIDGDRSELISDVGIIILCEGCKELESLNISQIGGITFDSILCIALNLSKLSLIIFHQLSQLDCNKVYLTFGAMFKQLQICNLNTSTLIGAPESRSQNFLQNRIYRRLVTSHDMTPQDIKFRNFLKISTLDDVLSDVVSLKEFHLDRTVLSADINQDQLQALLFSNSCFYHLEYLSVRHGGFGRDILLSSAVYCDCLIKINFYNCPDISDSTVQAIIFRSRGTLKELRCSFCGMLTDATVHYVTRFCFSNLSVLEFVGCDMTWLQSIVENLSRCKRLSVLKISCHDLPHHISVVDMILGITKVLKVCEIHSSRSYSSVKDDDSD